MDYPERIIKLGEADAQIVKALKKRLNQLLVLDSDAKRKLNASDPNFGPSMKQVVKLFQARHVDSLGRPLKQDGEIGSLTWEALFGSQSVPASDKPGSPLLEQVLTQAKGEEARQVREVPRNSNRGPQVDAYLKRVGVSPGLSWCCAFVYWCFDEAAKALALTNPMVRTAGCLDHWNRSPAQGAGRIMAAQAVRNPGLVRSGMVFIMDHGGGLGHTGLVEKVEGGLITTIEGNTDASRSREGGGVFRLTRKLVEVNKGFIAYGDG
jgi:CHAP domain